MKLHLSRILAAFLSLATLSVSAADWWDEMDYGRFLSASFIDNVPFKGPDPAGKEKQFDGRSTLDHATRIATNKGIGVKLGAEGNAAIVFDTELLRATGAWTGGWLKLMGAVFDGKHGPNPSAPKDAKVFFGTHANTPGWSKGGDFADPRALPKGPRKSEVKPGEPAFADIPFGPLPKDWAKYEGLYVSGDRVTFAYTVGAAHLLESPDLETVAGTSVISRTFNVLSAGKASNLLVADAPVGTTTIIENGYAVLVGDERDTESRTVLGVLGAPQGAKLVANGERLTLRLPDFAAGQKFKIVAAHGPAADLAKLTDAIKAAAQPADLQLLTKGGAPRWKQTVKAQGKLGAEDGAFPYVVDNLSVPLDNPYKSKIRIAGLDFFSDGRIAFSTWSGDVWIGKGIDAKLENIEWRRYATGLFHALGLKIVDDQVYVLGRDQITRLHDLNGDGEADFYENFNNDVQVTPGFHEFTFGLDTDPEGNFYFAKGGPVNPGGRGWGPLSDHNGCMFKVSKDGGKFEVFATGLRAPNGIGVGPNGEVTTGDNQGTWVPSSYIHYVKQGSFIEVPDLSHLQPAPTQTPTHLCWIPYEWCNSNGGQVWVTSDKWGPLKGSLLYLSYGKSALFSVLQEKVGNLAQGGVVKFPVQFESGICRGRFNPVDGQLYVAGLKGWQTNAVKDGAIHRVRYTGKPLTLQNEIRVTDKGITIGFTGELDTASASDIANYSIQQYNYRWTSAYGSDKYKVSNPDAKGKDPVEIKSVQVAQDKKSVFLEVPGLKPVMQMEIKMNIKSAEGAAIPNEVANTINVVPSEANSGKPSPTTALPGGKTPPPTTEVVEKKQGTTVTFTAGGKSDTRASRLVALFVPAGQPVSPFLSAGPFTAKWETEIMSGLRAEYTFSLDTNGVATATLNGAPLLDSRKRSARQSVQLQKGANQLVVEFESPKTGDASLRLLWSSKEFPTEPVPPTVFQHHANAAELRTGERLREGRLLFAQHRCAACHDGGTLLPPRGEGMPELAQDAPLFDDIGGKFREPWLAAWINDPHSIRPHSLMPRVFTGEDGKIDQRAADLAAYFASTATPKDAKDGKSVEETPMAPGAALFANLGCVACHTKPDADGQDEHERIPLRHVKAKWHPAALAEFLKDPAKSYRWIRMPHFRLSDTEAKQLASYLLTTGTQEFPAGPKGDSARGLQLMLSANCLSCHAGAPPVNTPTLAATLTSGWSKGCLAPDATARGKAPDFRFSSAQREALVAFAASGFDSLKHDVPAEFAARQMKNLRCSACHGSDGQPGVWSQLEEEIISLQTDAPLEEGEGKPIHTTALPALTWFGEKLRPDYLATFIAGGAKDKPRHWIVGRMPGFPTHAEGLANGLAHTHGLSTTIPAEPAPDAAKVKAGETLVGENGGFNCVQCHTLADRAATAVFEAPGPNLALSPTRLRKDYFHRWALAPTRIDPETKMPKFADDEGKTPLTKFFGGNASEQFDAIWLYLRTLKR